ncbi:YihY/virulence factor BrkB family protein [Alkalihalobacillus sp. LMS39]|uniref:YihY/virulence factor BrkB family protein n=1 Tax=Alkalihalobacillus sp. LMS39 TaxID=2924032 RepID=UPI001FB4D5F9|nr:YihY/virulence factor BrkB family protein [Alkalihalobacillus sp. LMS39]UOE93632.1 YihY/virulence factor BrkB family protein [Alkalihalobacillus sp. LMS39]
MVNRSLHFGKELYEQLKKDPIMDWAAQLAFFFMLSIFPLLIFILALLPYLPIDSAQLYSFVTDYAPPDLADIFKTTILEVVGEPQGGLLSFGILATIWSASNAMNALIRALNSAHNIDETRSFFKVRAMSILMTLAMVTVFFVTLLLPVFGHVILETIHELFHIPDSVFSLWNRLRWVIGVIVMITVLMLIYKIAPNKHIPFKIVIIGAVTATISWQLISLGFAAYVSNFGNYSATYGSLGGVIILMFWFYLSGMILVVSGEINATIYNIKHSKRPV